MKKYTVTFQETGQRVPGSEEDTLLSLMRRAGLHPDAPCGGQGKCGKCTAVLESGETVLACRQKVDRDMTVLSGASSEKARILTEADVNTQAGRNPVVRRIEVTVPPCLKGESSAEWTRFAGQVSEALSPCLPDAVSRRAVQVNTAVASKIGRICRETGGRVYAAAALCDDGIRILHAAATPMHVCMAAFDIGTTTVAAYLLDSQTGQTLATASCMNPQAQYGADVINRANYCLEHGIKEPSECIRDAVNRLLAQMAAQTGLSAGDIYALCIAGNTCMHHLFLEISPDTLVHAPYNPALSDPVILRAADYGICAAPDALLYMLPNIAGFVGADTAGCLVSSGLAEQQDWTLLIDIGTNGEMVLGRNHDLIACSTAAGPAFEGAGIDCGMRGAQGAISAVSWEDGKPVYTVIGGGKTKGICGSGLLDLAAVLLEQGLMDESGELSGGSVLLAGEDESDTGKALYFSQKDIRQLQLAKAAIAAGVKLLAKKKGIAPEKISQVWLAGAFGSFLSPDSACAIGLIPQELKGRIRAIGNAAGEGAKAALLDFKMWKYAASVAAGTQFLELATMPEFQDTYVDELEFPEQ